VQEADGRREEAGRQEVSTLTLRVLTRFSTTIQKSGRVPDFFWFLEGEPWITSGPSENIYRRAHSI
jgi:hypothetical protein